MAAVQRFGECAACGKRITKSSAAQHLLKCFPPTSGTLRIYVEAAVNIFWMYLSVPESFKLAAVDAFLRETWLECCGHLSSFTVDDKRYTSHGADESDSFDDVEERDMDVPVREVLKPSARIHYEYDFGSTTELMLKVLEIGGGNESRKIQVLARNTLPELLCVECGKPATSLCTECQYRGGALFCQRCAKKHKCGEEMMLPVVNSPRMGVCAYTGP